MGKTIEKMKKAGITTISMGIESGNQDILNYFDKKTTLDQIRRVVKLSRKTGLYTVGYFIVGSPPETKEHIERTIDFAKSLPLDHVVFSPFAYLKGSPLWYDAVKEGKIKTYEFFVLADKERGLGNFTEEEMWAWSIKGFRSFYLRPKYILEQIILSFIRNDFRTVTGGFHILFRNDNVLKIKDKQISNLISQGSIKNI